jgi:hypothetical protein
MCHINERREKVSFINVLMRTRHLQEQKTLGSRLVFEKLLSGASHTVVN